MAVSGAKEPKSTTADDPALLSQSSKVLGQSGEVRHTSGNAVRGPTGNVTRDKKLVGHHCRGTKKPGVVA